MTRLPTGRRSRWKLSPRQNSVGGVDRSTSSTNPGRGMSLTPPFVAEIEGDLDGAAPAGSRGMLEGFSEPIERIHGRHQPVEADLVHQLESGREGPVAVRVRTHQRDLALPQRRQIEAYGTRHPEQLDAAPGTG